MSEPPPFPEYERILSEELERARWKPKLKAEFRSGLIIGFIVGLLAHPALEYVHDHWLFPQN